MLGAGVFHMRKRMDKPLVVRRKPMSVAPCGSWSSPFSSDLVSAGTLRFGDLQVDGPDIYWTEGRPAENGRDVVVRRTPDGCLVDAIPHGFSARTRVHEYGGGAFFVADGVVHFSNFSDQRLYRCKPGPEPLTTEVGLRFADGSPDRQRNRIICVREDHRSGREPVNAIVALEADGGQHQLVFGHDFYASPRLSPDGSQLCWLAWNHPNMPWDGTELWLADVRPDGLLQDARCIAGGTTESIADPQWAPDGTLHFVSDRTGWWNLYRIRAGRTEALLSMDAEFCLPQWMFGRSLYGFESAESLVCACIRQGVAHLGRLDAGTGRWSEFSTDFSVVGNLRVGNGFVAFLGATPTLPTSVVRLDLATGTVEILRRASSFHVDPAYVSTPELVEFPTADGLTAFGFFYPPVNPDFAVPEGELPPLLVRSHGGPTSATVPFFSLGIQYWTSRGIGFLDVNYGGSTGYGRAYRERLRHRWGIVDVDDCENGAKFLVQQGRADPDRLMIDGGSAGGFTTLASLTFRKTFKAGASLFGVSDMEALVRDTHKFESRYLDGLVGPYPQEVERYRELSPIHHVDLLSSPIIFLQGADDPVVPPNQAELMVEALRRKGLPVAYVLFEGEQHGFRKAANIKRSLEAELDFFARVFGFVPADPIEPVDIENL